MDRIPLVVAAGLIVLVLFIVSNLLERRRLLLQMARESAEAPPTGPLPGPYPNMTSVLAFILGAGGLLPIAGLPFCVAAMALASRARREAQGDPALAPSYALSSAAAAFALGGVIVSALVAAHLLRGAQAFVPSPLLPDSEGTGGARSFSTPSIVVAVTILVFSAVSHEVSHGLAAYWSGDDTARRAGRLTLNPIPHLDPFGSILLPLSMYLLNVGVMIGWARPVPVRLDRLRDPRLGQAAVASAGVGFNFVAVLVFFAILVAFGTLVQLLTSTRIEHFTNLFQESAVEGRTLHVFALLAQALKMGILVNLALGLFNLLPLPPLDGANLLESMLPSTFAPVFVVLRALGCVLLPVVMILAFCLLAAVMVPAAYLLVNVLGAFLVRM